MNVPSAQRDSCPVGRVPFPMTRLVTNPPRQEQHMNLTIFAATGGTGRELLEQAGAAGHDVTAAVRNPDKLTGQVRIVTADLAAPDPAALESAVAGASAVLSGLGPRSKSDVGIVSLGTRAIIAAMKATGVRRLVVVSAAPVGTVASATRIGPGTTRATGSSCGTCSATSPRPCSA